MRARFAPGAAAGLLLPGFVALVEPSSDAGLLDRLEAAAGSGATASTVVHVLASSGITELPSFVIAVRHQSGWHVFVRGGGSFVGGEASLSAPRAAGWNEEVVADIDGATLSIDGAGGGAPDLFWTDGGRFPAGAIVVVAAAADHEPRPAAPAVASEPAPSPASVVEAVLDPVVEMEQVHEPEQRREPGPVVEPRTEPVTERVASAAAYAWHPPSDVLAPEPGTPTPPPSTLSPPSATTPPPPPRASGLIDGAPLSPSDLLGSADATDADLTMVPPADELGHVDTRPPGPPGDVMLGDHDGHTVQVDVELREWIAEASGSTVDVRTVQAVHCVQGHPNPPHEDRCRICGTPIQDHSVTSVACPVLGELRFVNGDVYPIDRPMVIGRAPSADDAAAAHGPADYRSVTLADARLSRTHAAVLIDGWQVLVVDEGSSNQTVVELPGQDASTLRPSVPTLIVPGTRIAFGPSTHAVFTAEVGR